jgi:hypothetical protein
MLGASVVVLVSATGPPQLGVRFDTAPRWEVSASPAPRNVRDFYAEAAWPSPATQICRSATASYTRSVPDRALRSRAPRSGQAEHDELLAVLATTSTQPEKWRSYLLRGLIVSPHGKRMQGIPGHHDQRWYQCPHRIKAQRPVGTPACECGRLQRRNRRECSLAPGFDPATARAAIRKLDASLVELRRHRDEMMRFRGKNLAAAGLSAQLRTLASQAQDVLDTADETTRRRVLELLEVRIEVLGWKACTTCRGNGLLARPDPRRRHAGGDDDRRGELLICPDCLRTRRIPVLRIAGQVPELLLATFEAGGTAPALTQAPGLVMPFEADIRVA